METPPPVPPKDPPYLRRMAVENTPQRATTSGSKRKRSILEDGMSSEMSTRKDDHVVSDETGYHSTKRSRSAAPNDTDTSDEATPAMSRSVKRKKKVNNLSNLNLRHAAHQQREIDLQDRVSPRGSKFQEGSLTDKPSDKPPSAFTRIPRTDSGNLHNVDTLMSDYHDDLSAAESTADATARERSQINGPVGKITAELAKKEQSSGLFTFGRSLVDSFHPVALWNKLWHQSKEELTRQNQEQAARKALQKAQAEAKYAEMKRTGLFGLHPEASVNQFAEQEEQPRDSGVMIDRAAELAEEELYTSSGLLPMTRNTASRASDLDLHDKTIKPGRGLKSRLTLKRPSLANLKKALRPAKSEYNLGEKAAASSSSVSPVKNEFDSSNFSTVRKSNSKYDLKKTHKLSKRVSDLETKLQQARRDLDNALVDASPMPKMNSKYERFTPSGTIRDNKFTPGRLPRLDSERILFAELAASSTQVNSRSAMDQTDEMIEGEPSDEEAVKTLRRRPQGSTGLGRPPIDPASELFEDDQETVKPARLQPRPPRASSTFSSPQQQHIKAATVTKPAIANQPQQPDQNMENTNTSTNASTPAANNGATQDASVSYLALDAKLKALNEQHKIINKQKKPVKRKSRGGDDEKEFKPDGGDDDEAEWKEATATTPRKRKKRKSSEKNADSEESKRSKKGSSGTKTPAPPIVVEDEDEDEDEMVDQVSSPLSGKDLLTPGKENRLSMSKRISTESQLLEPLYEEEEEGVAIAVSVGAVKPVLKSTPARQASQIPRSMSPFKSTPIEDEMMSRAGAAAQQHRKDNHTGLEVKSSFEWPDDVF